MTNCTIKHVINGWIVEVEGGFPIYVYDNHEDAVTRLAYLTEPVTTAKAVETLPLVGNED